MVTRWAHLRLRWEKGGGLLRWGKGGMAHLRLDPSLLEKLRRGRLACGVSKVVGVPARLLGCQQGCWGVSKVVGVSARLLVCQQGCWGVSKVVGVSARLLGCPSWVRSIAERYAEGYEIGDGG